MKPIPPQITMTHEDLAIMIQVRAQQLMQMICTRTKGGEIDAAMAEVVADRLHLMLSRWIATELAAAQNGKATLQ